MRRDSNQQTRYLRSIRALLFAPVPIGDFDRRRGSDRDGPGERDTSSQGRS